MGGNWLEAFTEKQPKAVSNPILQNGLGSMVHWRAREENTFALLEGNVSGKQIPRLRVSKLTLEDFPAPGLPFADYILFTLLLRFLSGNWWNIMVHASMERVFTHPACAFGKHINCDDLIKSYTDKMLN